MSDNSQHKKSSEIGLLPAGLSDLMPDDAMLESDVVNTLMGNLTALGYARVKPPLVEFEETLLADGPGASLAHNSFRVMDPQSSRMMAIRADMTAQIARLAQTRMAHLPRPLRLAYYGDVLRIKPDPLNPERQLTQVGAEMIGASEVSHDAELAVAALSALQDAGVSKLTVDLGVPGLLVALIGHDDIDEDLQAAVSSKDQTLVRRHADSEFADMICVLLDLPMTSFDNLAEKFKKMSSKLPKSAVRMIKDLMDMAEMIRNAMDNVEVTIDPLESRSFDYHSGIGFSIFSPGIRGELGRGGRYQTSPSRNGEISTGVTLYLERVLRAVPKQKAKECVYIPYDAGLSAWRTSRAENRICRLGTSGLKGKAAVDADIAAMGATHIWDDGKIKPLK
jgi:ATP phosphoribosyltransferase regulatory subunit